MWKKGFAVPGNFRRARAGFHQIVTLDTPGCDRAEILRRLSPYYTCIDRGGGMIEYVLKGYSKAAGLAAMLRDLGASREEAYAIGDSTNDLPMFEAAGHTAALGDGMAELQAKAGVHYGAGAGKRPGTGVKTLEIDMKTRDESRPGSFFTL